MSWIDFDFWQNYPIMLKVVVWKTPLLELYPVWDAQLYGSPKNYNQPAFYNVNFENEPQKITRMYNTQGDNGTHNDWVMVMKFQDGEKSFPIKVHLDVPSGACQPKQEAMKMLVNNFFTKLSELI